MSSTSWIYAIAATAGVLSVAAWLWLIVVPAWTAYSRVGERVIAVFLSLYVLVAFVGLGAGVGALFLYYFDEIG